MVTGRQVKNTSPTSNGTTAGYFGTERTARQGGYDPNSRDRSLVESGDTAGVRNRVESIFGNRNVTIGTAGESEAERLDRITQEIMGGRTFGDVRQSVDRLAGNADYTRESFGLAPVTQPQLLPEQIGAIIQGRRGASSNYLQTQADATEREARLGFEADMQRQALASQYDRARRQSMNVLGDRGMAFQPAGAGREMRQLGRSEADQTTELEARYGMELAQLAEMVAVARRQRDAELASLEDQEQAMRSALIRQELAQFA